MRLKLTVLFIALLFISCYIVIQHYHTNYNTTIEDSYENSFALLNNFIMDARETCLSSGRVFMSGFSKSFVMNSSIINETLLIINNTKYEYSILKLRLGEHRIDNNKTVIGGCIINYLGRVTNQTTTGGQVYIYQLRCNGQTEEFKVFVIPFIISMYNVYGDTLEITSHIKLVRIYFKKNNMENYIWILLEEKH